MNKRYVFDLDNTLVMTDNLNNTAYNYALSCMGFQPIIGVQRITRKEIFNSIPNLTLSQKKQIVELKQNYFIKNINDTVLNLDLYSLLESFDSNHCILWTSADVNRTTAILEFYRLHKNFKTIFYSDKQDIEYDIMKIRDIFSCSLSQLVFFDDNEDLLKNVDVQLKKII